MNPQFKNQYKQKKKRIRDPNAPPPPTLLGQVKELRTTKEAIDLLTSNVTQLQNRVEELEMKSRRVSNTVETLKDWLLRFKTK